MATTQKTDLHRHYGDGWYGGGADGRTSDVIARGPVKALEPKPAAVVKNAQEGLKDAQGPLTFTDDTTPRLGFAVVRWEGEGELAARREFVDAVVERAGDGGEWFVVNSVRTARDGRVRNAALVYCLGGEVVGVVGPYVLADEDGAE